MIVHPIPPLFDSESKTLILGSFPSVKSREAAFFYGHPQNRFWTVAAAVIGCKKPENVEEKKKMILENHLAMWDVIASCEIEGSADSTIKNVRANDIGQILAHANIQAIFVNGKTAQKYYDRYIKPTIGREAICLPSTSPANATYSLDRLIDAWKEICQYLQK